MVHWTTLNRMDFEWDEVSIETIRNWEQGRRSPTGAAKALLKILDRAPEASLSALH